MSVYEFFDYFLLVFHALITLFNMVGWAWKNLRKWNLITLSLTGASWFLLGAFKGWGYCPLTDLHWRVLEKLGRTDLPASYIRYTIQRWFSVDVDAVLVEQVTVWSFFLAFALSVALNVKDYRNSR
ncbi:MAG: DUF2784 domain-containing protein [Bacteroidales bacterium]